MGSMWAKGVLGITALLAAACTDDLGAATETEQAEHTGSGDGASTPGETDDTIAAEPSEDSSSAPASTSDTGSATRGSSDAGMDGSEGDSTGAPIPAFDDIPWATGDDVGYGIAYKDSMDPSAHSVFIGYAGYPFPLDAAQSWVTELYHARLAELGVRHVYAVQGPADVPYSQLEIGNSAIAGALPEQLGPDGFVLVAAHSSGSYVSHELFHQLAEGGFDPGGVTFDRVVYFNLDGGLAGIDGAVLGHLRRAYFVSAFDGDTGTGAANLDAMVYAGDMWSSEGGYVEVDATGSGCGAGAPWCLHMAVINSLPHDPWASDVVDYYDFDGRPVVTAYIDAKAEDAGLVP